jgi:hypothetical protein
VIGDSVSSLNVSLCATLPTNASFHELLLPSTAIWPKSPCQEARCEPAVKEAMSQRLKGCTYAFVARPHGFLELSGQPRWSAPVAPQAQHPAPVIRANSKITTFSTKIY